MILLKQYYLFILFIVTYWFQQINTCTYTSDSGCDPRCASSNCYARWSSISCCSGCIAYAGVNYYQQLDINTVTWTGTGSTRCSQTCPPLQYIATSTTCGLCARNCTLCYSNLNTNCITCASDNYKLGNQSCYNMALKSYGYNPCPDGYYNLQNTMTCQTCPTGCLTCNIALEQLLPGTYSTDYNMGNTACAIDPYCKYSLKCYVCSTTTGYFLEEGFCYKDQCRKYQYYNNTAGAFNPAYCFCMDGYYKFGQTCAICHYSCKTCSGNLDTQCLSCSQGYDLSATTSGSCNIKTTTLQKVSWSSVPTLPSGGFSIVTTDFTGYTQNNIINSVTWLFAYNTYNIATMNINLPTSIKLKYTTTSLSNGGHYGIHFKAKFLFIDYWQKTDSIIFRTNQSDVYSYNYLMENVKGQYIAGQNIHDHITVIDFWFYHTNSSLELNIVPSTSKKSWGLKDIIIEQLGCHSSCITCNGPSQYNCTSCRTYATYHQILVDGNCVCDIANKYYNNNGTCSLSCDTGQFKDNTTYQCISNCNFPLMFNYDGYCWEKCPTAAPYRKWQSNQCVAQCFNDILNDDLNNYYSYNGSDLACYQICPQGTYGDPQSKSCVGICPDYSTKTDYLTFGYFKQGNYCVQTCANSEYAFSGTRQCLTSCPSGFYINDKDLLYGKGPELLCEQQCSVTLGGSKKFGNNLTKPYTCVNICPNSTYADIPSHMCLMVCNASAYKQYVKNANNVWQGTCRIRCQSSTYEIFGNNITQKCQEASKCPLGTFGDYLSTYCQNSCTDPDMYGNNETRTCVNYCPTGYFKQRDKKICLKTCPQNNSAGFPEWGDIRTGFCELNCQDGANDSDIYYADAQQNRQCKKRCHDSPIQTYGQNFYCVFNCSNQTWADPFNIYRKCTDSCTNDANLNIYSYGQNITRKCVQKCSDTYFAQVLDVPVCLHKCQNYWYGDTLTNQCVQTCALPYYGDPTGNRTCSLQCAQFGYYALNLSAQNDDSRINRTCELSCEYGWADNLTRMCAMSPFDCSQGLFAHQSNHQCVLPIQCQGFADIITNNCVSNCSQNLTHKYFGLRQTKQCVLLCPQDPDYFGDNSTDQCQLACSNQDIIELKDPQNNRRCVVFNNCSLQPVKLYGDRDAGTCVIALNCSSGTFGDNNTNMCQSDCQGQDSLLYADPVSKQCVDICQLGYYALNTSIGVGICSQTCPLPQYADNLTVSCTYQCSNNTYGVNWTDPQTGNFIGTCETECPQFQFARDIDNLCLENCLDDHWGVNQTRKCVTSPYDCPDGYYADNFTHMCVQSTGCSIVDGIQYVADNLTRQCLPSCPTHEIIINWADMQKLLCVAKCPYNKYGDNNTLTCNDDCKWKNNNTYTGQYADPQLRICVVVCSAAPIPTFGQNDTYTCVQAKYCPANQWADDLHYLRVCVQKCPDPRVNSTFNQMFADNITRKCVLQCPTYFYGNIIYQSDYGICQSKCSQFDNQTLKFADNSSKLCVYECPEGTFGDQVWLVCVKKCPLGWFAQKIHSLLPKRYCVQVCDNYTWSQHIHRTCIQDPVDCPTIFGYHWYGLNDTWECVQKCPSQLDLWGENNTYNCQPECDVNSFKYNKTRVCIDLCPGSLDDDGSFSDQGRCVIQCITPGYYRDVQNQRSCQSQCSFSPIKYYKDDTTWRCVLQCPTYPKYYFAYDLNKQCRLDCPLSTMKDHTSGKCVDKCPNNTFFDAKYDACVEKCPIQYSSGNSTNGYVYYGDNTLSIPKCVLAEECPNQYFADDNVQLCVQNCSQNQWKYQKNCVQFCPQGYYGNADTGFCVIPDDCPDNYYANNLTKLCVDICIGSFADKNNQVCVDICPQNYFADPVTRQCTMTCTNTDQIKLYKNIDDRTCISDCEEGLFLNLNTHKCQTQCIDPLYADRISRMCLSVCPSVPPLYGQNDTNKCVQECSNDTSQYKYEAARACVTTCPSKYFKNNQTLFCVLQCYNNTYADTEYCVYNCSPKYSLDDPNICTTSCPAPFYKDPTTYKCVLDCPTSPSKYYKVITDTQRKCDINCPSQEYRDDLTYSCVKLCPPSPPTYADSTSGNCTYICSLDYYAHKQSRTCKDKCPDGMYADPISRMCVTKCTNGSDYYADNTLTIPKCVILCSSGTFANPFNLKCQQNCLNYPGSYGFDNTTHRICVISCPYPYVADDSSFLCKLQCLSPTYPYLDLASKSCVSTCTSPIYQYAYMPEAQTVNGSCVKFCPLGWFSFFQNNTCVAQCPSGYYGQNQNNTCYANCSLANNKYADKVKHLCTDTCIKYNQTYDTFADLYTRQCVTQCPSDKFTIKDNNTRKCQPRCTKINQYADWTTGYCVKMCPSTWYADPQTLTCIKNCSLYSERYIYQSNRSCVTNCLDLGLFSNHETRTCVPATQCPDGYFGLISAGICVKVCPNTNDLFGDPITHTCVSTCKNQSDGYQNYYADSSTRLCVKTCPQTPALFAKNSTRRCVSQCSSNEYADNYTRRCIAVCSIIPGQTFADNSTNRCVATCPTQPNYFSQNVTWTCVDLCPSTPKMYADYSTRKCVKYCPGNQINTYADQSSRFCVRLCPNGTFRENSTRTCQSICKTGYADPVTKYCIAICPSYSYGHVGTGNVKTCKNACPLENPMIYAQNGNNLCMTECIVKYNTYRDQTTSRCVKICPINQSLFADNISRICRNQCIQNYYADYSTRFCVLKCPQVPALYAILDTRVCSLKCPNNSWADNYTRACVIDKCPSSPNDTYGDNSTWTCVKICPTLPKVTWSNNSTQTCVQKCPSNPDYYSDNYTRKCVYNCSKQTYADSTTRECVQTCPQGWYGVNSTWRCEKTCPDKEFADELLNLCVKKCSVDPIYYGNPDNHRCVQQCPQANNSFGNPLTQQCVNYLISGYSGCPDALFADNTSRLCVPVCPLKDDTYGDNSTWKCVDICPKGDNSFADNSTMRCVKICPKYPQYYAEQYSRRCVGLCLQANDTYSGSFSDNSTRKCVQRCPEIPDYYSDNSTRRCVFYCPKNPLTFADYSTRRCVTICPDNPDIYGDLSTQRCVLRCPQQQQTYADYSTRLCVKVCPTIPWLFADTEQNRCVQKCPNGTFADNSSRLCLPLCPEYPESYGDSSTNQCVQKCPQIPDLYADQLTQQCVQRCPKGYYAQNTTRKCLPDCPRDKINYADNYTNRCVEICPSLPLEYASYGDNTTQQCVFKCPIVPFTYAENTTRMCVSICLNITESGFADNSTLVCVVKCPDNSYGDITSRYCVRYCPQGWFADDRTNLCQNFCQQPYFADHTTWRCVEKCPVSQLLFGQPFNRTCTNKCPQTTYADFNSQECVQQCPSKIQTDHQYDTFGYNQTNQCIDQCPIPLYGWPVTYVCVDICPDPYYQNITDHRCYKCPNQCQTCNYPQACLTCVENHYLYAGACVQSCPTFPVITYANPNRQCGTSFQCTAGYFALNITKSCVKICPSGYFKNNLMQICDSCQKGCSTCTNSSYCLVCNTAVALWFQFKCYMFCSPLRKFYTETGCVSQCPAGTYLSLTKCQTCSSICRTCVIQPQNCLLCANGYYLQNNLCVQKCLTNFKPVSENGSLICKSCSSPGVNCIAQPLTYTVTQYIQDFQYKFLLKFSQPVSILGKIDQIISIKKKKLGRLLLVTYDYLNYTILDYGNGLYEFVLKEYNPTQGTNQFEIQILQPQKIKSQSGQLPTKTRTSIIIEQTNTYTLADYIKGFTTYTQIIIAFSIILLFITFWASYNIWSVMFDFLQIIFTISLISIDLPPTPMYLFKVLKNSLFTYLPNFFTNSLPFAFYNKDKMNNTYYSIMKDFIFLRNMGQIYFIMILLVIILIGSYGISKKFFNKKIKKWCKKFIRQQFLKKYLFNLINILMIPIFLTTFLNFRDYTTIQPIEGFSIFSAWVFMVLFLCVIGFYLYKIRKISKQSPITYLMLQKAYNFITYQEVILLNNENNYFNYQKNQVDLKQGQYPRINNNIILPYPLQTRMGPIQVTAPLFNFLYKLLISLFIAVAYQNAAVQIFFCLLLTLLYSIYLVLKKPYIRIGWKQFTNEIMIHNLITILILLIVMLIFNIQLSSLESSDKNLIGIVISLIVIYGLTVNIGYFIYRTYNLYFETIWKKFVNTQLFKENYTVEHLQLVKKYSQHQELLKKKTKSRQQFLQAIKVQQGQALAGMVLRDPNHSSLIDKFKNIKLRPDKNQIIKSDIKSMFQTLNNQQQRSVKSIGTSQRLSKYQRNKLREKIFEQVQQKSQDQYEKLKIFQVQQQKQISQNDEQNKSKQDNQSQYSFQYIEQEYPQGTPIQEIMKNCKKGQIIIP